MISVDWHTFVITVPQSYLTFVSGTFYTMDTDQFRLDLKALESSVEGMPFYKTHEHNTEVTVAGTTFARTIEILAPYSVEFEDGMYSVQLLGSNNNIWSIVDGILVRNQVQVIPTNSAGLIKVETSDGDLGDISPEAVQKIVDGVWDALLEEHDLPETFGFHVSQKLLTLAILQASCK